MTRSSVPPRAAARGLVAAMAMTGARQLTTNLGLMEESPPETMVREAVPRLVSRLDAGQRAAVIEAAHWAYGSAGGLGYGLLPASLRGLRATGPLYGLAIWLGFEVGIAPLLGLRHPQGKVVGRMMLVIDHALYGVIVSGWLAPEPQVTGRQRR